VKRGQLESPIQWIIALLGGIALLGMLLFGVKSCASSGQDQLDAGAARSTATVINTQAWQPNTNSTIQVAPLHVMCPAGTLSLAVVDNSGTPTTTYPIDRSPVFLPAKLQSTMRATTTDLKLARSPVQVRYGSVLYLSDPTVNYYVIQNEQGQLQDQQLKNMLPLVTTQRALAIKEGEKAVVISFDDPRGPDMSQSKTPASLVWIRVSGSGVERQATIYKYENKNWKQQGIVAVPNDVFLAGAIITQDPTLYQCSLQAVAKRTRYVTQIMQLRLEDLAAKGVCKEPLQRTALLFKELHSAQQPENYLSILFSDTYTKRLSAQQSALLQQGCPVIA